MPEKTNKYAEAFKDEANLIGLGALFVACALTAPIVFPFVALPLEAAYLLFAPDTGWFKKRLDRKRQAEAERQRLEMRNRILPTLSQRDQVRFGSLEDARREIAAQENPNLGDWYRDVLRQLDYLIEKFLLFASKKMEYRRYIVDLALTRAELTGRHLRLPRAPGDEHHPQRFAERAARQGDVEMLLAGVLDDYDSELRRLERQVEREKDEQTAEILKKNAEVIRRSKESAEKIGRLLRNLEHQLELVVNTFSLINTQLRSHTPEQIVEDVNSVVEQSESLTQTLASFAPMDEALQRLERLEAG